MAAAPNTTPQSQLLPDSSPYSQDNEPDVTAYAEIFVRRMEQAQEPAASNGSRSVNESSEEVQGFQNSTGADSNPGTRSSTHIT